MTDKLSERAEQLAQEIEYFTGKERISVIRSFLQAAATEDATLARGVAIEQAAQVAKRGDHSVCAANIRALASTDAAQALAAHNAEIIQREHDNHAKFAVELYQIMIDPLAVGWRNEAELFAELKEAALKYRRGLAQPGDTPMTPQ